MRLGLRNQCHPSLLGLKLSGASFSCRAFRPFFQKHASRNPKKFRDGNVLLAQSPHEKLGLLQINGSLSTLHSTVLIEGVKKADIIN
jgi:hypothetical protein